MKKINYLILVALVAIAGFLSTSCKKETTEVNMVVRNWTLESKSVLGVNIASACEQDSKWNFKSDGTYVIVDACNTSKPGIWKLASDGKTLTLDNVTAYQVIEKSPLILVIEMQVAEVGIVRWTLK
jgi:hypothetical protein